MNHYAYIKPPCPPTPENLIEFYARNMVIAEFRSTREEFLEEILKELRALAAGSSIKMTTGRIGRLADVKAMVGVSRPTIDRLEREGDFPTRIRLGSRAVGWDLAEVQAWLDKQPRKVR